MRSGRKARRADTTSVHRHLEACGTNWNEMPMPRMPRLVRSRMVTGRSSNWEMGVPGARMLKPTLGMFCATVSS